MSRLVFRDYRPYGAVRSAWVCKAAEMLVCGPAGTGKTRGLLELLHLRALKYPNSRGLIARRERVTLTQTALVTWNKEVCPATDGARWRTVEQEFRYPNGSVVAVAGLDKEGQKVMSGQFDFIYVNEATELDQMEWENLTTRLRNGAAPYQQLFGDCNPDAPRHWLKQRCDMGRTVLFEARHEDNPVLWNGFAWTPAGESYLEKLDALTGARFLRLRKGMWAQAEGVVYEGWDRRLHLVPRFAVPNSWPRYWVVDFGFTNPFVCQWWAEDPDGRLYRYREIYRTQRLVEDHAARMLLLSRGEPPPRAILCDHDAEDRATLAKHLKMQTLPAKKMVSPGIQAVASRLRPARDGKPRLYLMADSLDERDAALVAAKKPTCTEEEVESYVWDLSANRKRGEEPLKKDDHGMDTMRYMVAHKDVKALPGQPVAGGTRGPVSVPGGARIPPGTANGMLGGYYGGSDLT